MYWIRTITNVLFKPLLPPFKVSFFNETQIPSVSKVKLFEFLRQKYSFEFKVGPSFAFIEVEIFWSLTFFYDNQFVSYRNDGCKIGSF